MSDSPAFVPIAALYQRRSRSGRVFFYGHLPDGTRVYLFASENRQPKDCQPEFVLYVRAEDMERIQKEVGA